MNIPLEKHLTHRVSVQGSSDPLLATHQGPARSSSDRVSKEMFGESTLGCSKKDVHNEYILD